MKHKSVNSTLSWFSQTWGSAEPHQPAQSTHGPPQEDVLTSLWMSQIPLLNQPLCCLQGNLLKHSCSRVLLQSKGLHKGEAGTAWTTLPGAFSLTHTLPPICPHLLQLSHLCPPRSAPHGLLSWRRPHPPCHRFRTGAEDRVRLSQQEKCQEENKKEQSSEPHDLQKEVGVGTIQHTDVFWQNERASSLKVANGQPVQPVHRRSAGGTA